MTTPRVILLTRYLASSAQPDSGIGRHFRILADALARKGAPPHVIVLTNEGSSQRAALERETPDWTCDVSQSRGSAAGRLAARLGWPFQLLLADLAAGVRAVPALLRARANESNAVVESHATGFPALFASLLGLPVIVRVSTTMAQLNRERGITSRWLAIAAAVERVHIRTSPALLTHTRKHRDIVCAEIGLAPARFAILPHGIPLPSPQDRRSRKEPRLLFVGRFERRKGIDLLLASLPSLLAAHRRLHVVLAGDRGHDPIVSVELANLPADQRDRVQFLGRTDDVRLEEEWQRATVFVAPSRYESFGLMYVEAMTRGVPPVGCAVGGVPDVIRNGENGLLVPADDPAALVTALDRILSDDAFRGRLSAGGLAARERFSDEQLASASQALYSRFLAYRAGTVI